jgi:hypothetical protein
MTAPQVAALLAGAVEEAKRGVLSFVRTRTVPGDRVVLVTVSNDRYRATTHAAGRRRGDAVGEGAWWRSRS